MGEADCAYPGVLRAPIRSATAMSVASTRRWRDTIGTLPLTNWRPCGAQPNTMRCIEMVSKLHPDPALSSPHHRCEYLLGEVKHRHRNQCHEPSPRVR